MSFLKLVTPHGALEWVNIAGEGVENLSGKLQYKADLVLDGSHAESLKATLDEHWAENKPKGFKKEAKSLGYYPHKVKNQETGEYEESGKTMFSFKTATSFPDGSNKVVKTYNAKNRVVALGDTKIGNGSRGAVSGVAGIYTNKSKGGAVIDAGVTLYLDAIQITKLVEFTQDAGFGAVDDDEGWTGDDSGFQAEESAAEEPKVRL